MTHKDKLNYLRIAGGIVGFSFRDKDLDMIVSIYDKILEKKGKTDLGDIALIKHEIEERYKAPTETEVKE